ncbi:caspase-9 isoform X5 [Pleurodeles waltl]|uniref:caspase-9 isoform X5 n=1 Tax=Pleurodeles waltl TaxID=8319 RepID=UPI0037097B1D
MDELQRSLLQRNRLRLVTQLQVSDLWDLLLQKGLFSQDMIEDIRRAGTRRDQARQLVIDLQTRGSLAFPLFVECLEETGQTELAELLREGCRKQKLDPIHIRPIEMLMPAPKHDMMSKKELPYQSASTQLRETQRIKEAKGAGDVIEGNNRKNSDKVYILEADPCGFCLIINNVIFEEHTDLSPRNGSNIDCQKLRNRFTAFHFEVLIRENLTGKEIHKELQTLAAMDHSQLDCCVVVILSHGCEVDGTGAFRWTQQHQTSAIRVQLYRVMLPHLVRTQEAKISPMQLPASRLQVMSWCPIQHFPIHPPRNTSICELLNCMTLSFVSWRDHNIGTWYVETLDLVLAENADSEDLQTLLVMVSHAVASKGAYKQIPGYFNFLRKRFFFNTT